VRPGPVRPVGGPHPLAHARAVLCAPVGVEGRGESGAGNGGRLSPASSEACRPNRPPGVHGKTLKISHALRHRKRIAQATVRPPPRALQWACVILRSCVFQGLSRDWPRSCPTCRLDLPFRKDFDTEVCFRQWWCPSGRPQAAPAGALGGGEWPISHAGCPRHARRCMLPVPTPSLSRRPPPPPLLAARRRQRPPSSGAPAPTLLSAPSARRFRLLENGAGRRSRRSAATRHGR